MSLARLVIHEKSHKETSCVCSVPGCSYTTSNIEEFRNHMKTAHAPPAPPEPTLSPRVPCKVPGCSRTFTSVRSMRVFYVEKNDDGPCPHLPQPHQVSVRVLQQGVRAAPLSFSPSETETRSVRDCCHI